MKEFQNIKIYPRNSNIVCWWDGHQFEGKPVMIPNNKNDDNYSMYGVFCSPECACA